MLNILGLKSRNLITVPLDLPDVTVLSVSCNEQRDVIITVVSTQVGTPCQHCGQPHATEHVRDLGLIHSRAGALRASAEALEQYLLRTPAAPDAQTVRATLDQLLQQLARLN